MLIAGTRIGNYEIVAGIGAGGMGEVYRATDSRLGRNVALKILPRDVSSDPDRLARFQREARAVASLNHPSVVTLYSVEEENGLHFLTMELIEGQSLDRLITENGLPVEQIVRVAGELAEALAAAHEKGIVHRDLKPGNVMLTGDGRVKVLDFGLAKDFNAQQPEGATMTSAGRTEIGVVMGTPAYMSPEQVSGRALDHRSDIFSLGVMLHEMATGRRPFQGESSAELVSSILRDDPPSVTDVRPQLPGDLARVIRRCLEKDPRHRVQTARDVSNEFRDMARTTTRNSSVGTSGVRAAVPNSGAVRADEGFWVAVLPFKYSGSNQDLAALAEGLSEEVVTGLSRFSYLRVIARSSTAKYSSESRDVRTVGEELGARYVMQGSLRQAGAKVRIAVQLVDAGSGASLWAETYDRTFTAEAALDLADDVVPRMVATVGDTQGILAHSMTEVLRNRDPESLTPYESLLRSFGFHQHVNEEEHTAGIKALEKAVQQAPDRADCWAMLSWLYRAEYTHGYNERPNAMDRSLEAAQRAVKLAPANQLAHAALASAHFFRHEVGSFRVAAERALALNRMEGYTTAFLGLHFAYSGDWERGCALCEGATQLNPNHPGWYWLPLAINAYRQHDGERALQYVLKVNMPGLWTAQVGLAGICSQCGQMEQARSAVRDLLACRPNFAVTAQRDLAMWWQPEMVEQMLGDLRRAGLGTSGSIAPASQSVSVAPVRTASGESRADEGFWVAVLPFKYSGSNEELKALTEGLTDEIITGLARFSYLRVVARGSTAKYTSESGDVREIGKSLGARYVMEGSVRQAGSKLRLAVQLSDTVSGTHLWAETYERAFAADAIFELQDDLVPRIVSTVADQYGVLPRSISEVLRRKSEDALTPHEAVLRAFSYFSRIGEEEHATVRRILERAIREAPEQADCWAMLSMIYRGEFAQGYNAQPNSLDRALAAAQRAVEISSTHVLGHYALATVYFFRKEMVSFRVEADRALVLNPFDASVKAYLGLLIAASGEWDRGCQIVESAMQLNPNCPGYFYFAGCVNAYRLGKYREALEGVARINMPGYFHVPAIQAAALGQLGRREEAQKVLRDLLVMRPDFVAGIRSEYAKWYDKKEIDSIIEGLRKAGLEIPDEESAASAP